MSNPNSPTPLHVAVGILQRPDGRVLMAERPADKDHAGFWEFPGGKSEDGEHPERALARELHEELGIEVETVRPWITRVHAYPEKTVRLHFFRVHGWRGEPHGRENQRLSWQNPQAVSVMPLLPANDPVMRALSLPPVYAITQAAAIGVDTFIEKMRAALQRGIRLIQIREAKLSHDELARLAADVIAIARDYNARVLINDDIALARRLGADGVHLPMRTLMTLPARPDLPLCAASCHNREELDRAAALGVDFALLSPVLPTASHPGEPTLGWERFTCLVKDLPMPVYALGGMQPDLIDIAMQHGAHGVAMLRGAWL